VLALEFLQNAPDAGGALREIFRMLRPGGRLSFSDFKLAVRRRSGHRRTRADQPMLWAK